MYSELLVSEKMHKIFEWLGKNQSIVQRNKYGEVINKSPLMNFKRMNKLESFAH